MRDYFYAPENHYWRKADGGLFSSARAAHTTASDPQYIAWLAAGGTPTAFPRDTAGEESERELAAVLAAAGCIDAAGALSPAVESAALLVATDAVTGARGVEDLLAIIEHMAAHINQLQSLLQVQGMPEMKIIPPAALLERIAARQCARGMLPEGGV